MSIQNYTRSYKKCVISLQLAMGYVITYWVYVSEASYKVNTMCCLHKMYYIWIISWLNIVQYKEIDAQLVKHLMVTLLRRLLSVDELDSCATNISWHSRAAADVLVSLFKPDLTGMNCSQTVGGKQSQLRDTEGVKWGGGGNEGAFNLLLKHVMQA